MLDTRKFLVGLNARRQAALKGDWEGPVLGSPGDYVKEPWRLQGPGQLGLPSARWADPDAWFEAEARARALRRRLGVHDPSSPTT